MTKSNLIVGILLLALGAPSLSKSENKASQIGGRPIFKTGLIPKEKHLKGMGETHVMLDECSDLPESFDLRDLGVVSNIKNQGSCGSCWAFSKTASLESAIAANGGSLKDLSEQQLVSCDRNNGGCRGGNLNTNEFQVRYGQAAEASFPYTATGSACKAGLQPVAKGTAFNYVGKSNRRPTSKEVMCALYKSRTIPWITLYADNNFKYKTPTDSQGVITACTQTSRTNHAIGVVGWKTINGKVYFKIRNSWGTKWGSDADHAGGERGYALMQLGCNNLGDEVAYIQTDAMPCKVSTVKLPAEIVMAPGDEVRLGVRPESGVEYEWFKNETSIGTGEFIYVSPSEETVYSIKGKTSCGSSESSVRVKVQ